MRKFCLLSVLLLITWLISCSRPGNEKASQEEEVYPVEVITVAEKDISKTLHYVGTIEAFRQIKVYSKVPDHVKRLYVDVGSVVARGDTLAIIENDKIRNAVIQAKAGLETARARYANIKLEWERIKKLYADQAISQSQYDNLKTQLESAAAAVKQAEAALNSAESQLRDTYILAPFDGVISTRDVEIGDLAVQRPLFTLVEMDKVKILIDVIERELSKIKVGQKAIISVAAHPDREFEGEVSNIYPTLNPLTRAARAEIVIPNLSGDLKPGMFAEVSVVVEEARNVPVIPNYVILRNTQLIYDEQGISTDRVKVRKFVWVIQGDLAIKREIITGIENDYEVQVLSGLKAGDLIVSIGQHNLSDTSRVTIVKKG